MIKRILSLILCISFLMGMCSVVSADNTDIHIFFNDKEIVFDKKPTLKGNTIMCEVQGVFDAIGIKYDYNGITKHLSATYKDGYFLDVDMGDTVAIADYVDVELEQPFYQDGNKVMMPLDSVCYIYNINIDRTDLSHIVLKEKEKKQELTYAEKLEKIIDELGIEPTVVYSPEVNSFMEVAGHNSKAGEKTWWVEETIEVNDDRLPFDTATRVSTQDIPEYFYTYQISHRPKFDYKANQLVVLSLWAKGIEATNDIGKAKANVSWEVVEGWKKPIIGDMILTNDWKKYVFVGTWDVDLGHEESQLRLAFMYNPQKFDVSDITMEVYDIDGTTIELPDREPEYKGVEEDAIWRKEALKRIDKYRKNNVTINVVDESGNPVKDAKVNIDMTRSEMNWGFQAVGDYSRRRFNTPTRYSNSVIKQFDIMKSMGMNTFVDGYNTKPPLMSNDKYETVADSINLALSYGFDVRLHALGWDQVPTQVLPKWSSDPTKRGVIDETTIRKRVSDTANMIATYGQLIDPIEVDVYNEVASFFGNSLHNEYGMGLDELKRLFYMSNEILPNSVSIINEASYGGFAPGTGRTLLFPQLLKYLKDIGCEVEGAGMQGHVGTSDYPWYWYMDAERLSPYVDHISVTEYDQMLENYTIDYAEVRDTLIACYAHPKIKTFIVWKPFYDSMGWARIEVFYGENYSVLGGRDAWMDLVKGEWWTKEECFTDESGKVELRVHRGEHDVNVTVGDKNAKINVTLTQDDEKNVITAVVSDKGITLQSPIQSKEKEKHEYVDFMKIGKRTEFYDFSPVESKVETKNVVKSCKDIDGIEIPVVLDMDSNSSWQSKTNYDSLTIELEKISELKKLEIEWGDGAVKRFKNKIEVSEDGENWILIRSGLNSNVDESINLDKVKGKYIRISADDSMLIVKEVHTFVH